jgi:putative restriction endonuclease
MFKMDLINAAFKHVNQLELLYGDSIPAAVIEEGFQFNGETVLLLNRVGGIFKPRQMAEGVLSIKTTMSRDGAASIYNDQLTDDGYYQYSLQNGDPRGGRNVCLWQAYEKKQPFIYFHAIAPAVYKALWPCFIDQIYPEQSFARVLVGIAKPLFNINSTSLGIAENNSFEFSVPDEIESRYLVRESKVRMHQASFRKAVLDVYQNKCAITGMAEARLIEAAHIIPDGLIGKHQVVNNGIALSNLHHRAYDRKLIGIDADYKIHVSEALDEFGDNDFVQKAFHRYDQKILILPRSDHYKPNKDYLAQMFEVFKSSIDVN